MTYKIAVLLFVFIYYGFILGLRSYLLYRNTGINALKSMQKGVIGYNEKVLGICSMLVPIIAVNYVFFENNYQYLVPIEYLEIDLIQTAGVVLSVIGLVLTFVAQLQMKDAWRIGIDNRKETVLVTNGMYRFSRNCWFCIQ